MERQQKAWNKFARSGSVADYLSYRSQGAGAFGGEAVDSAAENRRSGHKGQRHGRK